MTTATPPRFAVVGAGRSGTGYVAEVLRTSGASVGHEHWFNPIARKVSGLDGDVSWLALPTIESGEWSGPVVHVIRNPVANVRSFCGIQFFDEVQRGSPFVEFAYNNVEAMRFIKEPVHRAVWFWIDWNRRCSAVADVSLYLEDLDEAPALELLAETVGVDIDMEKALAVSKRTNSKGSTQISERWIKELVGSDHFGYFT